MQECQIRDFEELVQAYQSNLLRLCYLYLRDESLAQDAVQESFIKAYRAFDGFAHLSNPKTWLTRIAVNTCKDMRKSSWFRYLYQAVSFDAIAEIPNEGVQESGNHQELVTHIMQLPQKLREVVLLYYYQDINMVEIANILGISQQAVSTRLKRAKLALQKVLKEDMQYE